MFEISNLFEFREKVNKYFDSFYYKNQTYDSFIIRKKDKFRIIESPNFELKNIQKAISNILSYYILFTNEVHGFVNGRNILTNAQAHINSNILINLDIKNFFHSISYNRIFETFSKNPFLFCENDTKLLSEIATYKTSNLNSQKPLLKMIPSSRSKNNVFRIMGETQEREAKLLNEIASYETSNMQTERRLPIGSPLSPIISNIICNSLDRQLCHFAKLNELIFTRYADDITFSSRNNWIDEDILKEINKIINNNGFEINAEKTKLKRKPGTLEVTGILINNGRLNVKRRYLKVVRAILFNWKQDGIKSAIRKYISILPYTDLLNESKFSTYKFLLAVRGKIEFIGMVCGKDDKYYSMYLNKYYELLRASNIDLKAYSARYSSKNKELYEQLKNLESDKEHSFYLKDGKWIITEADTTADPTSDRPF